MKTRHGRHRRSFYPPLWESLQISREQVQPVRALVGRCSNLPKATLNIALSLQYMVCCLRRPGAPGRTMFSWLLWRIIFIMPCCPMPVMPAKFFWDVGCNLLSPTPPCLRCKTYQNQFVFVSRWLAEFYLMRRRPKAERSMRLIRSIVCCRWSIICVRPVRRWSLF